MLSKEECGHALSIFCENNVFKDISDDVLEENYHVLEQLINEHFELVEEYKKVQLESQKYFDELCDGGWHDKEYQEFKNPQPYKFEDLKDGMWVWDKEVKAIQRVYMKFIIDEENDAYVKGTKIIRFGYKFNWRAVLFKENRFYPVQMANMKE